MVRDWRHDDLVEDLAAALGTQFVEVPLGSVYCQGGQVPRADVVLVRPSYTRFCLSVFEVKVGLADLQADLREGKWRAYLPHCHRFYFALPAALGAQARELPAEAGLYVRGPAGWAASRRAQARELEIPAETLLALLFMRERHPARWRRLDALRLADGWHDKEQVGRLIGRRAARGLAAVDEYEAALRRIATEGPPDEWEAFMETAWGDEYSDLPDGTGIDDGNCGDVHGHGYHCGLQHAAKIARAALRGGVTGGPDAGREDVAADPRLEKGVVGAAGA